MAIKIQGNTIIDDGRNIINAGITTVTSVSIGNTQVISSGRQLQNIASLDVVTTATIESSISNTSKTFSNLTVTGISTLGVTSATDLKAQQLNVSGVTTSTGGFVGNLTGNASSATYATSSGIATYATNAGISTNVIGGIGSLTQLQVTGVSTFTNGPVLVGSATSTGTASQRLQVTGGAYVSGNTGIGTTNPTSKLSVIGDGNFTGVVTATSFVKSGGTSSQFLKADGSVDSSTYLTTTGSGTNLTGIVTSITAGSGISIDQSTGNVTITNSGGSVGAVGISKTTFTYISTEGQTTFNATYNVGYVDVYLNGSKLSQSQYTATTGTSIVLNEGASLNDVIEIIGFGGIIGVGIATEGGIVGTGVTLLDFRGAGISTVTVSSGIGTINIEGGGGSTTPDISPVMMGMIF